MTVLQSRRSFVIHALQQQFRPIHHLPRNPFAKTMKQVKGSMMFNDDFLEEEYTILPHYDGTEVLPVRRATTLSEKSSRKWNA